MDNVLGLLEEKLGIYQNTNTQDEYRFNCPYCGDIKYHLYVNPNKGLLYCQRCDRRFHISQILGYTPEYNIRYPRKKIVRESIINIEDFAPILDSNTDLAGRAKKYIESRGIYNIDNIWYGTSKRWSNRVVFPVIENSRIVYAVGRAIVNNLEPRYLNTSGDKPYIYRLNEMRSSPHIVITEGCIDALSAPNTVALMGKTMNPGQLAKFRVNVPCDRPVYIALDNDATSKAVRLSRVLLRYYKRVYIVLFPEGEDMNSVNGRWKKFPIIETKKDELLEL